jgi:death-on-curing family protein
MTVALLNVTAEELRAINRRFGGTQQINSTIEAVFQSALYVSSFWEKVAIVVRSIAGGHLFDNGNKRTAFEAVKLFRKRNQVVTGTLDHQLRETVRIVATNALSDVRLIARSLKGF